MSRARVFRFCAGCLLLFSCAVFGQPDPPEAPASGEIYPPEGWQEYPDPLASRFAEKGGMLVAYAGPYPKSFNYYLEQNVFSAQLFGFMYETLLSQNSLTLELEPMLASRWMISADKRSFTFYMDPAARWSDGRPVTIDDVEWTFHAILDEKNLTGPHKIGLARFDPPTRTDDGGITFHAKEVHWDNLLTLAGLQVLPQHSWSQRDFNLIHFEFPVVSGPYGLGDVKEGIVASLNRRPDWWAASKQRFQQVANFDVLRFRFFENRDNAFEAFKKGEIDLFPVYTAHVWARETSGDRYARNWIVKQNIQNHKPIGFQGVALNMRNPPLDDIRVRKALAHLYDRKKMNETLMYNAYFLHRSYYEDLYDAEHPCANDEFDFNPEKARALLDEAGWKADPKSGLLMKGGQPLRLRYLSRGSTDDKFTAIFQEDLKKVGIEIQVAKKDWAAWAKDMDEYNFDMTWAAWSAGLFKDPESMWYSAEGLRPGGQNLTGFSDEWVDCRIDEQRTLFDVQRRHDIVRRIDAVLAAHVPYILLWNKKGTRLLYWNKFGTPSSVLGKYGDERSAYSYWWADPDAAADLQHAVKLNRALPPKPPVVEFDETFVPGE